MDSKQRMLLETNKCLLADALDYDNVVELLKLAKVLDEDAVELIESKATSKFAKNILLIAALKDTKSITAFEKFVTILEITSAVDALKLIAPESLKKLQVSGPGINSFRRLAERRIYSQTPTKCLLGLQPLDEVEGKPVSPSFHTSSQPVKPFSKNSPPSIDKSEADKKQSPYPTVRSTHSSISTNTDDNSFRNHSTNNSSDPLSSTWLTKSEKSTSNNMTGTDNNHQNQYGNVGPIDRECGDSVSGESVVCWHPYHNNQPDPSEPGHCCLSSQIITPSTSQSSTTSEPLNIEPSQILQCMVDLPDLRTSMKVQHADVRHLNMSEDYKMTSRPRGPCLIINNIEFDSDIFPQRKGSDEDAEAFDVIFQQLGFIVILRRNQTAEQMKALCKEIASQCKKEHDALFVIILSHGSESGIYGTDGIEVDLNDIVSYFDNKNCKAMLGKPKVFVIQACRGRMVDYGEAEMNEDAPAASQPEWSQMSAWTAPNTQVPFTRRSEFAKGINGNLYPVRSDMLLIFSCLAGYVSVRNELVGSWLGAALSYFILKHAHEKDLSRILNMVSADIRERISSEGYTQCIEVTQLGWSKNLYFNPGVYI